MPFIRFSRLSAAVVMLAAASSVAIAAQSPPDYLQFDDLLLTTVRNGYVDYDGIAADGRLETFIRQLGTTRPEDLAGEDDRKAFFINAYNAIAIHGILNGQSAGSAWKRRKFFKSMTVTVLGQPMSMEDIEHGELRTMGDPRIHFAIVCASLSCPRLNNRAYFPETLDAQLDQATAQFVNDLTRNRFDNGRRIAYLSAIFDWFAEDFEAVAGSVQKYIASYATDPDTARLLRSGQFKTQTEPYDWGLNGSFDGARRK